MCELKVCTKCNIKKEISHFEFRSDTNKYRNYCSMCNKSYLSNRENIVKDINNLLLEGLKKCGKCKNIKILDEFNNDKQTITGKTSYCKDCIKNKYTKSQHKEFRYKTRYNISLEEYNNLLKLQNNSCDICKLPNDKLVVDHCHTTGKIRGLLCTQCNSGLGMFRDNIPNILEAINYLNKNK